MRSVLPSWTLVIACLGLASVAQASLNKASKIIEKVRGLKCTVQDCFLSALLECERAVSLLPDPRQRPDEAELIDRARLLVAQLRVRDVDGLLSLNVRLLPEQPKPADPTKLAELAYGEAQVVRTRLPAFVKAADKRAGLIDTLDAQLVRIRRAVGALHPGARRLASAQRRRVACSPGPGQPTCLIEVLDDLKRLRGTLPGMRDPNLLKLRVYVAEQIATTTSELLGLGERVDASELASDALGEIEFAEANLKLAIPSATERKQILSTLRRTRASLQVGVKPAMGGGRDHFWTWVLGGSAAAILAVSGLFYYFALSDRDESQAAYNKYLAADQDVTLTLHESNARGFEESGKQRELAGQILLIVGGALAATTFVYGWKFAPMTSPDVVGASVGWRW